MQVLLFFVEKLKSGGKFGFILQFLIFSFYTLKWCGCNMLLILSNLTLIFNTNFYILYSQDFSIRNIFKSNNTNYLAMVIGFSDPWYTSMSSLTSFSIMDPFPSCLMLAKVILSLAVLSWSFVFQNKMVGVQRASCSSRVREFIFSSGLML